METTGRSVAIVAVLVLFVALGSAVLLETERSDEAQPVEHVPADVDYVGYLEPEPMYDDPTVESTTRRSLRFQDNVDFYDGPSFPRSFAVPPASPLDPGNVSWVVYFGRSNGSAYDARVVSANWTADDLVSAVEERHDVTLSPGEYRGRFFHEGDGRAVAVLSDGTFAVGNTSAVRDAVNVTEGEAEPVDGPLREEFEATSDGYVRYAYRFRPSNVPDYPFVGDSVRDIEYVGGAYYRNEGAVGVTTNLSVAEEERARNVEGILNAGITFYRIESENASLREELEKIELERDGREVRISYRSSPEGYRVLIRGLIRNEPEQGES